MAVHCARKMKRNADEFSGIDFEFSYFLNTNHVERLETTAFRLRWSSEVFFTKTKLFDNLN